MGYCSQYIVGIPAALRHEQTKPEGQKCRESSDANDISPLFVEDDPRVARKDSQRRQACSVCAQLTQWLHEKNRSEHAASGFCRRPLCGDAGTERILWTYRENDARALSVGPVGLPAPMPMPITMRQKKIQPSMSQVWFAWSPSPMETPFEHWRSPIVLVMTIISSTP